MSLPGKPRIAILGYAENQHGGFRADDFLPGASALGELQGDLGAGGRRFTYGWAVGKTFQAVEHHQDRDRARDGGG